MFTGRYTMEDDSKRRCIRGSSRLHTPSTKLTTLMRTHLTHTLRQWAIPCGGDSIEFGLQQGHFLHIGPNGRNEVLTQPRDASVVIAARKRTHTMRMHPPLTRRDTDMPNDGCATSQRYRRPNSDAGSSAASTHWRSICNKMHTHQNNTRYCHSAQQQCSREKGGPHPSAVHAILPIQELDDASVCTPHSAIVPHHTVLHRLHKPPLDVARLHTHTYTHSPTQAGSK